MRTTALLTLFGAVTLSSSFTSPSPAFSRPTSSSSLRMKFAAETSSPDPAKPRPNFEFSFVVPKKGIVDVGTANVALPPLLPSSEVVVVRYDLPFELNAEPAKSGQVEVTKDGGFGKEKVGDILRQTTEWRNGRPGIFDVSKNAGNFDRVVKALVSNDLVVADEIVMIFERPV